MSFQDPEENYGGVRRVPQSSPLRQSSKQAASKCVTSLQYGIDEFGCKVVFPVP